MWRLLSDAVAANHFQQLTTVVLLTYDEADPQLLANMARLWQLDAAAERPADRGSFSQAHRLQHLHARLLELAELRIDIEAWQEADTTTYLQDLP